jgi:hypothetical protein
MVVGSKKRDVKRTNIGKSRKAQFTIFVILGLVILFAFAFAIYSRAKIVSTQLSIQADRQIKTYLDDNSINQYVTSCLDSVTDEVITKAALQGGTFNFSGKILGKDYVEYYDPTYNRTVNVSIVIDANNKCPDPDSDPSMYLVTQDPPYYPWSCGYVALDDLKNMYYSYGNNPCRNNCTLNDFWIYSGFFGINKLPVLCDAEGENKAGAVSCQKDAPTCNNFRTCDYYADYSKSMQKDLEEEISREIADCVNFTGILNRTQSNITVIGRAVTNITFDVKSLNVEVEYPFTVMMQNKQPITRMVYFGIEKDIPFKELYEYMYELANTDVKDVKFNITTDWRDVVGQYQSRRATQNIYDPDFRVGISRGNISNDFTDIIILSDINSNIHGHDLVMNFATANRRPALEYLHEYSSSDYDVIGIENETLILKPQGYDPDEEKYLRYDYSSWKEDYDEYYNFSNPLCEKPQSLQYVMANCVKLNTTASPLQPHNWTNSVFFKSTQQQANYMPTRNDAGFHNVSISVTDRAGLSDYQVVRVLVFDLPKAVINFTNFYKDVPQNMTSIEDMYLLNGSESLIGSISQALGASFSTFVWNDTVEPFDKTVKIVKDEDKWLYLPDETSDIPSYVDILNIPQYVFTQASEEGKIHNISLTVNISTGLKHTAYIIVNVTECLNHHNPDNFPYPYNHNQSNLMDALRADHACCSEDFKYDLKNTTCYTNDSYGGDKSFINYISDKPFADYSPPTPPTNSYNIQYIPIGAPVGTYDNDIYYRTFTRNCSGNRGNTCTGDAYETRTDVTECQDNNIVGSPFDRVRCSGPDPSMFTASTSVEKNPGCYNYTPGYSFESLSHTGAGDAICTQSPQYALGIGYGIFAHGDQRFICDGQCDGMGGCNYANATNCKCQASSYGTGDSKCDGLAYPGNAGVNIIKSCSFGDTNIADVCSSCGLIDSTDHKCRSAGNLSSSDGCTAAPECNGHTNGASITPNHLSCTNTGQSYFADMCSNCGLVDDTSVCRGPSYASGTYGCSATQCDGITPGRLKTSTTYCKTDCSLQDCGKNRVNNINPNNPTCYIGCTSANAGTNCISGMCVSGTCT